VKSAVKLVKILATKEWAIHSLGSASVDLENVANGPFTLEAAKKLQELRMGRDNGMSALDWLSYAICGVASLKPAQVKVFDEVLRSFVMILTALNKEKYTEVDVDEL